MKQIVISIFLVFTAAISFEQGLVKIGDKTPKYVFNTLINAPFKQLDISELNDVPTILSFWGTWCSSCIPEMKHLGNLQKQFGDKVQIIGVSNDNEQKLKNFIMKQPTKVWFASDPTNNLWNLFDLETAGHSVLIDKNNRISAITETEKIDSIIIVNLINSNQLNLAENRGTKKLSENQNPFKIDSTTIYSFVLQPELKGVTSMMKQPNVGPFGKRRISIINLKPAIILREAYDISLSAKIVYPTIDDSLLSNQNEYCIDFIIPEQDKSDLKHLFQNELNKHLPVNGVIEKKNIDCYILRPMEGKQVLFKESNQSVNEFSYNGLDFEGKGILIGSFISYLENEMKHPIYDETKLTKYYDIDFSINNIEPLKSTRASLEKIGLELVEGQREFDVLVIKKRQSP